MKTIILICSPLKFHVGNDENILFEWLSRIPSIKAIQGVGRELHLSVSSVIPDEDLLDLMGVFKRYGFDTGQLDILKTESNKHWFED